MVDVVKLMKYRIGQRPVLDRQLMLFGTMVQKIYIVLDLKEWYVNLNGKKLGGFKYQIYLIHLR